MDTNHMAIDQYGNTFHDLGAHPRKALLERLNRRHADKMYCDMSDGSTMHIGWIIRGHWLQVFKVSPMLNRRT